MTQDGDFQTVLGWADKFRKLRVDAHIHSDADLVAQVIMIQTVLFCSTHLLKYIISHS